MAAKKSSKSPPPRPVGVPNANNPEYRRGAQTSRVTVNRATAPKLSRQRPTKSRGR